MLDETREEAILLYFAATKKERGGGMAYFSSSPRSCNYDIFFCFLPFFCGRGKGVKEKQKGERKKMMATNDASGKREKTCGHQSVSLSFSRNI